MTNLSRNIRVVVLGVLALALFAPTQSWARDVTIVGEINDQNELVSSDDGAIYEIADNEMGNKLIGERRGEKIRVFGKLVKPVQESSVDELPKGLIEVNFFEDVPE